jgi:uncharacterized protein (UPF0332 family)
MKFGKLLELNKIEKVERTGFSSALAEKDLEFAKKGMEIKNYDRVMSVAYESVLRAINNLMNSLGYRAIGGEHHKNAFEFMKETNINSELVSYFDRVRRRRNDFVYQDVEVVSKEEAEQIIAKAEEFVQEIRTFVQKKRTGKNEK